MWIFNNNLNSLVLQESKSAGECIDVKIADIRLLNILLSRFLLRQTWKKQSFGSALFFADPDPGKNLHADPDPGGIRGRGLGVKGKNDFFF